MSSSANRWLRFLLAVAFGIALVLKVEAVASAHVDSDSALVASLWAKSALVVLDAGVVMLLLSPRWRAGCVLAMLTVVGGSALLLAKDSATQCGCLGRVALDTRQHLFLSCTVFAFAAWAILAGREASATRGRRELA